MSYAQVKIKSVHTNVTWIKPTVYYWEGFQPLPGSTCLDPIRNFQIQSLTKMEVSFKPGSIFYSWLNVTLVDVKGIFTFIINSFSLFKGWKKKLFWEISEILYTRHMCAVGKVTSHHVPTRIFGMCTYTVYCLLCHYNGMSVSMFDSTQQTETWHGEQWQGKLIHKEQTGNFC